MGDRAVIATKETFENNGIGIYLHYNGGRDFIEAFLRYCELKGYRPPDKDCYGWARLCQIISNYFGGTLSIGMATINNLDTNNGDNGTYIIEGWNIVDRKYFYGEDRNVSENRTKDLLVDIDSCQPPEEQLGALFIIKNCNIYGYRITEK